MNPFRLRSRLKTWLYYLVTLSPCHLVILCCASAGCTNRGATAPVWLAHIADLSGPEKDAGQSAARGIRLAVEEINKDSGQWLGHPLKVIHSDTRGKLEALEAEAVRVVAVNRVALLLGGTTPDEVERLDRAHATVVTPCGARPRGASEAVWFTGISPTQRGKALARFAFHELKADRVLLVQDERREGTLEIAEALARELPLAPAKTDARKPGLRRLRLGETTKAGDLAKMVQDQLKEYPAQAIVFVGQPDELRELGQLPRLLPVLLAGTEVAAKALMDHGSALKDLHWVTAFVSDGDVPRAKDFAARYKTAFGEDADVHAALAYENLKLLYEAMCRTKSTLTDKLIREELDKAKDFNGLTGALSFTKDRQLLRPAFVVRLEGGSVKTVKRYEPNE
jgi:branched-chain amino acid transport system substrate-binding protein